MWFLTLSGSLRDRGDARLRGGASGLDHGAHGGLALAALGDVLADHERGGHQRLHEPRLRDADLALEQVELALESHELVKLVLGLLLLRLEHGNHVEANLDLLVLSKACPLLLNWFDNIAVGRRHL